MRIIPFEAAHLARITPRWPGNEIVGIVPDLERWASDCEAAGPAMTILIDDEPIAAAGVALLWPGVGEAWTFVSSRAERAKLSLHRGISRGLDDVQTNLPLRRVQAVVRTDYARSQRWVERLGFVNEGLMRKYGPEGADYYRYGRLR